MPRRSQPHANNRTPPSQSQTMQNDLPASITTDPSLIHLDGRTLEGGGQLVRLALCLSALTAIPIHVHHIRGGRAGNHGGSQRGGLKSSHLAALEFLARATAARTMGAFVGSTEVVFEPGKGRDREALKRGKGGGEVHKIQLSSPGSVWLILQAILPWVIFAAVDEQPVRLMIEGGTNVSKSMSGEYVQNVMVPMFEKIGLPRFSVDVEKRGWTNGRSIEIGRVNVEIGSLKKGERLLQFFMTERGDISALSMSVIAGTQGMRSALIKHTTQALANHPNLPPVLVGLAEPSDDPKRIYLLIVASTSNGYRLGRDWLYDQKIKTPYLNDAQTDALASKMAQRVTTDLLTEIAHGHCVDEFMRDQLVVFEALAQGTSVVAGQGDGGEEEEEEDGESLHTKTCRWVVQKILGNEDNGDLSPGTTPGIGFVAGEVYFDRDSGRGNHDEAKRNHFQERDGGSQHGENILTPDANAETRVGVAQDIQRNFSGLSI